MLRHLLALLLTTLVCAAQTLPTQLTSLPGRSFARVNTLGDNSPDNNYQGHESLAIADGILYAIWIDHTGTAGRDAYVARSADEGFSWSPMVRVDVGNAPGASDCEHPTVVALPGTGPRHTLLAFWEDSRAAQAAGGGVLNKDIYYNRSTDGGLTWLPAALPLSDVTTSGFRNTDADNLQVAVDGNDIHVIWLDQTICNQCYEHLFYRRSSDQGQTWTPITRLNTVVPRNIQNPQQDRNDISQPKIVAEAGMVTIVFMDNRNDATIPLTYDIYRLWSPDGGQNWLEGPIESGDADATDVQIASDGTTIAAVWVDKQVNGGGSIRGALSFDAGLSFGPEIVLSPSLEAMPVGTVASQPHVAIEGSSIIVVWCDARGFTGNLTEDVRKVFASTSVDFGATWTTELALDGLSSRFNQNPRVEFASGTAFTFFEVNAFGSNRAAFTATRDGGVSWTAPTVISIGAGTDIDSQSRHEGPFFVVSAQKQKAWAIFRDRPLGRNEVYVTGVSAPFATLNGGADTNGVVSISAGTTAELVLAGAPLSATGATVLFGLSFAGSAPAVPVGNQVVLHLAIDPLTLILLQDPFFQPIITASIGATGEARGAAFPWPLGLGSPNLSAAAIAIDAFGQPIFGTDPVTILTL